MCPIAQKKCSFAAYHLTQHDVCVCVCVCNERHTKPDVDVLPQFRVKRIKVRSPGNCMFTSLSDCMSGFQILH